MEPIKKIELDEDIAIRLELCQTKINRIFETTDLPQLQARRYQILVEIIDKYDLDCKPDDFDVEVGDTLEGEPSFIKIEEEDNGEDDG